MLYKPVQLRREVFYTIKHIPLPKSGADGDYIPFSEMLGQPVTKEYRPSLQTKTSKQRKKLSVLACEEHTTNGSVWRVSNVVLEM